MLVRTTGETRSTAISNPRFETQLKERRPHKEGGNRRHALLPRFGRKRETLIKRVGRLRLATVFGRAYNLLAIFAFRSPVRFPDPDYRPVCSLYMFLDYIGTDSRRIRRSGRNGNQPTYKRLIIIVRKTRGGEANAKYIYIYTYT